MKSSNHIVIHGWMRTELDLKGNDLLVYAIIYGFSQAEEQAFTGSLQYLADWCGATKSGIQKNLKNLLDRGLIQKNEIKLNLKRIISYTTELYPIQLSCINNINNTIINNSIINKNNSKELLQNQDFQFGKTKQTPKKDDLFTKCLALIDSYDFSSWSNIRQLLIDYLLYRISIKDKPLYANMWKGMLNKLAEICGDSIEAYKEVIQQSIERGYLSFYPVHATKNNNFRESVEQLPPGQAMTPEDYEKLELLSEERRRNGLRTEF